VGCRANGWMGEYSIIDGCVCVFMVMSGVLPALQIIIPYCWRGSERIVRINVSTGGGHKQTWSRYRIYCLTSGKVS